MIGKLSPKLSFKVFDSQILPILEYGSEIWLTGKELPELERVQTDFIKSTLGVRQQTPTLAIYGDTGRFPLLVRQKFNAMKYWERIVSLPEDHPVKNAYNMLRQLHDLGFKTWCQQIYSFLEETDLLDVWECQSTDKYKYFMSTFKEKIVEKFIGNWKLQTSDNLKNPKLRTYSLFKTDFCVEPYLFCKGHHLVTATARLRMSSHDLRIERGRYDRPITPSHKRICRRCNTGDVDNEKHFIVSCTHFNLERESLLSVCKENILDFNAINNTFLIIMSSREELVIKALSSFIYSCFKKISVV